LRTAGIVDLKNPDSRLFFSVRLPETAEKAFLPEGHVSTRPIVTIDGPAGAGKSTISKALARRLHFTYLDTGALYRVIALAAQEKGIDPADEARLAGLCRGLDIAYDEAGQAPLVRLDGVDVTERIRSVEMGLLASQVSASPAVRAALLDLQRRAGERGGLVAEGRDMGTVVFPHADFKFFLDASVEERAERRYSELAGAGAVVSREEVLRDIVVRDNQDRGRRLAPLAVPHDAVIIDSTKMTILQVVEQMADIVKHAVA
jgi:CMP/dCMP kinase